MMDYDVDVGRLRLIAGMEEALGLAEAFARKAAERGDLVMADVWDALADRARALIEEVRDGLTGGIEASLNGS